MIKHKDQSNLLLIKNINLYPSPIPTPLKDSQEGFLVRINELIAGT